MQDGGDKWNEITEKEIKGKNNRIKVKQNSKEKDKKE